MNPITMQLVADEYIRMALKEDINSEDVSTNAVMPEYRKGEVQLLAKADGIIAGLQVFESVFKLLDEATETKFEVKDGDTVLFEFEKPLDCRKITIKSGAYQTSHYIITHAIVEISTDGERFIRSGWFDAEGDSEVICTVPIKALRIVFTEPQYEERLVLQDLKIE